MKKRFLSILLALSMLCAFVPITASAYDGTKYGDYLYYKANNDNTAVIITDCDTYVTEIIIPSEIDGLPVTEIGDWAFSDCSSLTSVTIPDSVTMIGLCAFGWCSSLTSVTIPDSVTIIGRSAFGGCSRLTSVTIPDSVTSIGIYAFYNSKSLTDIVVDEKNTYYSSFDGVLYNKDKTELIQYPIGNARTEFAIPDSVTSIGDYAFRNCSSLTSITIPDGVTSIGSSALGYCKHLADITVDKNNNYYLSTDGVLYNKDKTELIQYPIGNTRTEFAIPDSVTSIGSYAFSGCSSLTSVTIPNSVTGIDYYVFEDCSSLTDVYFTGTENQWNDIDIYYGNDKLENVTIHFNSAAPSETPTPTPTPVPVTTPEITKSETDTEYIFEVDAEGKYEDCYVYVAVYDENGALIEINCVPLDTAENTQISVGKNDNGRTIKIFIWTDTLQPIIDSAKQYDI